MNKKQLRIEIILRLKNAVMLVILPIFFTFLFGFLYGKIYVEEIPLAVLDLDNSSVSRNIERQFESSPGFRIVYHAQSDEELQDVIDRKKAYAGLVIPKDFAKDSKELKAPKTMLLIDETNLVIGNNALAYGGAILNTVNGGIQLHVLEGKGMVPHIAQNAVQTLSFVERLLYDPQLSYWKYLFMGLLGIFVQQTYLGVLAPLLVNEKARWMDIKLLSKEGLSRVISVFSRILIIMSLSAVGFTGCLYISHKFFGMPLLGSVFYTYMLLLVFLLDLTGVCFIMGTVFNSAIHCAQFCMFLAVPTILTSGYIWPEYMMPAGFGAIVRKVWPLLYFINPLRDMHLKGTHVNTLIPYIQGALTFGVFWLVVGVSAYIGKMSLKKYMKNRLLALAISREDGEVETAGEGV